MFFFRLVYPKTGIYTFDLEVLPGVFGLVLFTGIYIIAAIPKSSYGVIKMVDDALKNRLNLEEKIR